MKRIEAVIFDWAGTTVDHGSLAPVRAVTELFARHGVALTDADARRDMGIFKKDHIRRILAMPHIGDIWRERCGSAWDERQVEMLFQEFQPLQMEILEAYSQVIPGVAEISERLRGRGLKLGSTTGYTRPMLDALLRCAVAQGYRPDAALCPDDTGGGRQTSVDVPAHRAGFPPWRGRGGGEGRRYGKRHRGGPQRGHVVGGGFRYRQRSRNECRGLGGPS